MRTAILHIGTEKTGTTTLQHFLAENRARLAASGFAYPSSAGVLDSRNLVLYALDPARCDDIHLPLGLLNRGDRVAFGAAFAAAFASELESLPSRTHTVVLSSEHCHSRLVEPAEIARVAALLAHHVDRVEVLVYLRRQDRVAVSLHSTALKAGQIARPLLPPTEESNPYYNYAALLERWSTAFGQAQVKPRLFEQHSFAGGSLIADFCAACGIACIDGLKLPANLNRSITPEAQAFLAAINPYLPPYVDNLPNPERGALSEVIGNAFAGVGCLPPRAAAIQFQAVFERSNEQVRARWFPHRASLFDDDFSAYPEDEPPPLAIADTIRVAAEIWRRSVLQTRRLEAEIAYRDGRLAWLKRRHGKAERCFRRALALDPDHTPARGLLKRVLEQGVARHRHCGSLLGRLRRLARTPLSYW